MEPEPLAGGEIGELDHGPEGDEFCHRPVEGGDSRLQAGADDVLLLVEEMGGKYLLLLGCGEGAPRSLGRMHSVEGLQEVGGD